MELDFDKVFVISNRALRLCRAHPYVKRNLSWAVSFLFLHGIFTFTFILIAHTEIYFLKEQSAPDICKNVIFMTVYCVVTFMHFMMTFYLKDIKTLIKTMKLDYKAALKLSEKELIVVKEYASKGRFVTKLWLYICLAVGILFPLKYWLKTIYSYIIGEPKLQLLFHEYSPDIMSATNDIKFYLILAAVTVFYDIYANFMYVGFAPFCPIIILHACGQMGIIKLRMETLFPKTGYSSSETISRLKDIIRRLQNIYSFVNLINEVFTTFYEFLITAGAILLPFIIFIVIEEARNAEFSMEYVSFIFGTVVIIYLPCCYSSILMEMSEQAKLALYASGWESHMDKRVRSLILVILTRAAKPVVVKAIFRDLNLNTFSEFCHLAYGIFNILNTIWE